jgi:tetratricopeptide (TPR) repeat protein
MRRFLSASPRCESPPAAGRPGARSVLLLAFWAMAAGRISAADVSERFEQGREAFAAGRIQDALRSFESALPKAPNDPELLQSLGLCYERLGNPEKAAIFYRKALASDPARSEAREALRRVEAALRSEAQLSSADALYQSGRYREAIAAYGACVRDFGPTPKVLMNLGNCYEEIGDLESARRHYRQALEMRPGFADAQRKIRELDRKLAETPAGPSSAGPERVVEKKPPAAEAGKAAENKRPAEPKAAGRRPVEAAKERRRAEARAAEEKQQAEARAAAAKRQAEARAAEETRQAQDRAARERRKAEERAAREILPPHAAWPEIPALEPMELQEGVASGSSGPAPSFVSEAPAAPTAQRVLASGSLQIGSRVPGGMLFWLVTTVAAGGLLSAASRVLGRRRQLADAGTMQGVFPQIPLTDLLQMLALAGKTGTLTIETEQGQSRLELDRGSIVGAWSPAAAGEKTLYAILGIESGTFVFREGKNAPQAPRNVDMSVQNALLEWARQQDEASFEGFPPDESTGESKIFNLYP